MTAANRVYRNDDVFRVLAQHCSNRSLVALMRIEKKGTIYDTCVKELYKEVNYEVVKDMMRDTPRRCQSLDAVIHIKSNAIGINSEWSVPMMNFALDDHAEPCSPAAIGVLRLKCPNLRVITRHNNGRSGQRFTILLEQGKQTGTVRFHDQVDLVPNRLDGAVTSPIISMPVRWQGWIIKHTVGLGVISSMGCIGGWDSEMKSIYQDANRLDYRVTELQTGWLPFTLSELGDIVSARTPGKNPISRISSTVEPFDIDQLSRLIMTAGKSLYQLHLHSQPHPSRITLRDLPAVVRLFRTQCPKLVHLRLPMSLSVGGVPVLDSDIDCSPSDFASGPGKIRVLRILVYDLGNRQPKDLGASFSWNFARNMASLLAPDFELSIAEGPVSKPMDGRFDQAGFNSFEYYQWCDNLKAAIKFFQNLGPALRPHFATSALDDLGIAFAEHLRDLRYDTSGKPHKVTPTSDWSYGKKRTWEDLFYGDDPHYQQQVDRDDEERQEYLYWKEEEQRQADEDGYTDFLNEREQQEQDARDEAHQEYLDWKEEEERQSGYTDFLKEREQEEQDARDEAHQEYLDWKEEEERQSGYTDFLEEREQEEQDARNEAHQEYLDWKEEEQRQADEDGYTDFLNEREQEKQDAHEAHQDYLDMMDEQQQDDGDDDDGHDDYIRQQNQEQCDLDAEVDRDYLRMMNEQQRDIVDMDNVNIGEQATVKPPDSDEQILRCDGGHHQDLVRPIVQEQMDGLYNAQQDILAAPQNLTQQNAIESSEQISL